MSVEISNIQNTELRHAAEVADLNDNTANSGKLDQKELSVFIREAVRSGCDKNEIVEICNGFKLDEATDDVKASMEKLNQLQKLERELEYQNKLLEQRQDEIEQLEQEDDNRVTKNSWKLFGSLAGGVAAGAAVGAAIGSAFAGVGAVPGAVIGGILGFFGGAGISTQWEDHRSNYNKISEYEAQAQPIKDKVEQLEAQIEDIEEQL